MKIRGIATLLLLFAILLSLSAGAIAVAGEDEIHTFRADAAANSQEKAPKWEDYTDVSGHWAEPTLKKGFENGLIKGFEDETLRPDSVMTAAQMITILTRVLGATQKADISPMGIDPEAWYYEAAALAYNLGILDGFTGSLDGEMTRQDAFAMMARTFALTPANPDLMVLNAFSDSAQIELPNYAPIATLVADGIIQGFDGALNVNGSITRAEFLTILYRVAENYVTPQSLSGQLSGGTVVQGSASVSGKTFDKLWFDCSASSVSLSGVKAAAVTLKSHALSALTINSGSIGTLIIDCGSANVKLGSLSGVTLDTVRLQSGGSLTLTDSVIKNIEITGSNQTVTIGGSHERLIIRGTGNKVKLSDGAEIGEIYIMGKGNTLETAMPASEKAAGVSVGRLEVYESDNAVSIVCAAPMYMLFISGNGCWVSTGFPQIESVTVTGSFNTLYLEENSPDSGDLGAKGSSHIRGLSIKGESNIVSVGGTVDSLTVDGSKNQISGSGKAKELTLNATGCSIAIEVTSFIDNSKNFDVDRVLALVTSKYQGDRTLEWAEAHDYEDYEKEIWVNAKGYSSKTDYLIWINLAMQRVNIFTGSKDNWTLIRSCIIGSGGPGSGTPVGVYYTTYKQAAGWTTSTYTCRPVVGFKENSGYAFHSRLYYPNSDKLTDPSIGFPVSHGCIRMYDEDINYIYDQIPLKTTVVVF